MVKYFFIALFSLFSFTKQEVKIRILDKNIQSGKNVTIQITNNTDENYCFVIDSAFYYSKANYNGGVFINPKIFLTDSKNKDLPIVRDVKDSKNKIVSDEKAIKNEIYSQKKDTLVIDENKLIRKSTKLSYLTLKKGESIKVKIPFCLVIKYLRENVHQYYEIDREEKYSGSIVYRVDNDFIKNNCSKNKIDSIRQKGFKIFIGELNSNKVPLVID